MAEAEFVPMSVGQILDRTFKLYRENFVRFVAIIAVVHVPVALLGAVTGAAIQGAYAGLAVLTGLVTVFLAVVGQSLGNAALLKSVSESYLGNEVTVGEAYRFVLPKIFTVIWAGIMVGIITTIGFVLLVVPGVIFALWLYLTIPAIVVENLKASRGMSRSKSLVSGNLGKVFGVAFVVFLIGAILGALFQWVGSVVVGPIGGESPSLGVFIGQVFSVVGQVLAAPIGATASILLYYDLRIRKEAFDLEMLANSMGAGGEESDAVAPA